jgi:hypothetical protein
LSSTVPRTIVWQPTCDQGILALILTRLTDLWPPISGNMCGAWSNLVTGARPEGLVDCFLMEADGVVQVVALWESTDAHDRALGEEDTHPAFAVFEAMDADPTHAVFKVVGDLGR